MVPTTLAHVHHDTLPVRPTCPTGLDHPTTTTHAPRLSIDTDMSSRPISGCHVCGRCTHNPPALFLLNCTDCGIKQHHDCGYANAGKLVNALQRYWRQGKLASFVWRCVPCFDRRPLFPQPRRDQRSSMMRTGGWPAMREEKALPVTNIREGSSSMLSMSDNDQARACPPPQSLDFYRPSDCYRPPYSPSILLQDLPGPPDRADPPTPFDRSTPSRPPTPFDRSTSSWGFAAAAMSRTPSLISTTSSADWNSRPYRPGGSASPTKCTSPSANTPARDSILASFRETAGLQQPRLQPTTTQGPILQTPALNDSVDGNDILGLVRTRTPSASFEPLIPCQLSSCYHPRQRPRHLPPPPLPLQDAGLGAHFPIHSYDPSKDPRRRASAPASMVAPPVLVSGYTSAPLPVDGNPAPPTHRADRNVLGSSDHLARTDLAVDGRAIRTDVGLSDHPARIGSAVKESSTPQLQATSTELPPLPSNSGLSQNLPAPSSPLVLSGSAPHSLRAERELATLGKRKRPELAYMKKADYEALEPAQIEEEEPVWATRMKEIIRAKERRHWAESDAGGTAKRLRKSTKPKRGPDMVWA